MWPIKAGRNLASFFLSHHICSFNNSDGSTNKMYTEFDHFSLVPSPLLSLFIGCGSHFLCFCFCRSVSSVQLLSRFWLFVTPCLASLSITNSWSLLKLMSIQSVMLSNYLILCPPLLLLLLSIFPSIRVFSNESILCIRWPKYWSFSFSISPSNKYSGLISFRMDWFDLWS